MASGLSVPYFRYTTMMMASPTASTEAPTSTDRTTKVSEISRDPYPSPEAKSARFAPNTDTWNDMMLFRRFFDTAIEAIPRKSRAVPVAKRIVWSAANLLFASEQADYGDHRPRKHDHQDEQVPGAKGPEEAEDVKGRIR